MSDNVTWIATAVMVTVFIVEAIVSYFLLRDDRYGLKDTFSTIAIAIIYLGATLGLGVVITMILFAVYDATPLRWSMDHWWHWVVLFLVEDFCHYWSHRASHAFPFMWASHAVHHNSRHLNLSTGLRNSWVGGAIDWIFFVPAVALGFHPLAFAAVVAVASAWDFMAHTAYIGRIPILDAFANTPTNHRVHHSKNPRYRDKNFGGGLMVWDRMFGTYEPLSEKPEFGIDEMPRRPHDPFYVELYLWGGMLRRAYRRIASAIR
jgi:sterol desaturase/sphingolipid hydroxylase (fatty acid hydroxylase superfamily)